MADKGEQTNFICADTERRTLGTLGDNMPCAPAFVDNSGSTCGAVLKIETEFVRQFSRTEGEAPPPVALWNTRCGQCIPFHMVDWVSGGQTEPACVVEKIPADSVAWLFLTDGEAKPHKLAAEVHKIAHLSVVAAVVAHHHYGPYLVERIDISVPYAPYCASNDAVLLLVDQSLFDQSTVRVVTAKGRWADHLATLGIAVPEIDGSTTVSQLPRVSVAQLATLPVTAYSRRVPDTVVSSDGRTLNVKTFLEGDVAVAVNDFRTLEADADAEAIVRFAHGLGRIRDMRRRLQQINDALHEECRELELKYFDEECRAMNLQSSESGDPVGDLIASMMKHSDDPGARRQFVRDVLDPGLTRTHDVALDAARRARDAVRRVRGLVEAGLAACTTMEMAGFTAAALSRSSNRAKRAGTVSAYQLLPMQKLDLDGAPDGRCSIMDEDGSVSIMMRTSDNVMDTEHHIDCALVHGPVASKQITPYLVGIRDGYADKMERRCRTLDNDVSTLSIPIVSLANPSNRDAVFKRLCVVFVGGATMPHVWQIFLSAIDHLLANVEYAAEGQPLHDPLAFMARQIMQHATAPALMRATHREGFAPLVRVYRNSIVHDVLLQQYPLLGTLCAARLLCRYGDLSDADAALVRDMAFVAVCRSIPQAHRTQATSLWTAIYKCRTGSATVVPVAGRPVPIRLDRLVDEQALALLRSLSGGGGGGGPASLCAIDHPNMVVPLRNLVFATIQRVKPTDGAMAAIDAVLEEPSVNKLLTVHGAFRKAWLEADTTAPPPTVPDIQDLAAIHLGWADAPYVKSPPFVTPLGPSVIEFRFGDEVVDVLLTEEEINTLDLDAMVVKIHERRDALFYTHYLTDERGNFVRRQTRNSPVHRAMRDTWAIGGIHPEHPEFVKAVLKWIVDRGIGNIHAPHLATAIRELISSLVKVGVWEKPVTGKRRKVTCREMLQAELDARGWKRPHTDDGKK